MERNAAHDPVRCVRVGVVPRGLRLGTLPRSSPVWNGPALSVRTLDLFQIRHDEILLPGRLLGVLPERERIEHFRQRDLCRIGARKRRLQTGSDV